MFNVESYGHARRLQRGGAYQHLAPGQIADVPLALRFVTDPNWIGKQCGERRACILDGLPLPFAFFSFSGFALLEGFPFSHFGWRGSKVNVSISRTVTVSGFHGELL